jgi:hypothetical protein
LSSTWCHDYPGETIETESRDQIRGRRLLLAFVGAQAGIYALFYGFVYPASRAYHDAHPYSLLHDILMVPPGGAWRLMAPVITVLFGARAIYLAFIHRYVQKLFSHNRSA